MLSKKVLQISVPRIIVVALSELHAERNLYVGDLRASGQVDGREKNPSFGGVLPPDEVELGGGHAGIVSDLQLRCQSQALPVGSRGY